MSTLQIEHPLVKNMSSVERSQAAMRVAMQSPEKMKEWLVASGRTWLVFNSAHLVDSCLWPYGAEAIQGVVAAYRDYRATVSTGATEMVNGAEVEVMHDEALTVTELDRCIRHLIGQITAVDPTWSLERDPA